MDIGQATKAVELCWNKNAKPLLRVMEKGIKGEEATLCACGLCDGRNMACGQYIRESAGSTISTIRTDY